MQYRWPKFSELYGDFGQRLSLNSKLYYIRQVSRYFLRCLLAQEQIKQFVISVNQNNRLVDFFQKHQVGAYRIVCSGFVNKKFTRRERLRLIEDNFSLILALKEESFQKLLKQEEIVIYAQGDLEIVFKINGTFEEGFFAFEIKFMEQRSYGISFCFDLSQKALIIGSLQGLAQGEEAREVIKILTKKCFGLRPQALLVELMRFAMKGFASCALLGVAQTSQMRFAPFGKKGYFIDYDALWKEMGGIKKGNYFDITQSQRRSLDEIPSQKRSMYKKRFALLDELQGLVEIKMREMGF